MPSTAPRDRSESRSSTRGAVRTEIVVGSLEGCPVAQASADTGRLACRVSRSTCHPDDRVVGEFELSNEETETAFEHIDCHNVFQTDTGTVYRFESDRKAPCACQVIESLDIPLSAVTARDGDLHLTFHASDVAAVRDVVTELRKQFDDVSVRHLRHSGQDDAGQHVVVDRGRLTDRQLEVLETAHCLGYFEHPRDATGEEVADVLDIAPSTFAEHLAVAQRKLMDDVLDCDDQPESS